MRRRARTGLIVPMCVLLATSLVGQQTLNLTIVQGEGAINYIRQRTAREVIVQVADENRRPLTGVSVAFTLPNQGASGAFLNGASTLTLTTDTQGRAVASYTPNQVEGKFEIRIRASDGGQSSSIAITQSNLLEKAATGPSKRKVLLILALIGGAVAAGTIIAVNQGNGNGSNGGGGKPPTTVSVGTPSVGGPP